MTTWMPIESAPRDGTLLRLLVEFEDHATEDDAVAAPTIGSNSFDLNGENCWQFAGWNWTQDHWTDGVGKPVGWMWFMDASVKEVGEVVGQDSVFWRLSLIGKTPRIRWADDASDIPIGKKLCIQVVPGGLT